MFKRTKLSASLLFAFGGAVASTAAIAQQALERVEITGSSIRRVQSEGALPVQVLKREDVEKTGATSLVDLLQKLPGIQGATTEASSVGGGGGGFSGVSIHNLDENRTLVLLNGRRMAAFGGQTLTGFGAATDLNTIPIAAIERVEILTDGASALYGSDAVAGVVNFITRRNLNTGEISVGMSNPQDDGASEKRFSITKGFGDIDTDGFNVLMSFSANKRTPLNAPDREVSKSGVINFSANGKRYQAFLGSPSAIPGNVLDDAGDIVSPYYLANGECRPGNVASTDPLNGKTACYFDFVGALEIFPERERKNFMLTADVKLGDSHRAFADVLLSRNESTGIIAPVPGSVSIPLSSPLYAQYLTPVSGTNGSTFTGDTVAFYRVADLGRRADGNKSDFRHFVLGLEGQLVGWDYKTSFTHSENEFKNNISGYPGALALSRLRASGLLNPFVGVGEQPQASLDAIRGIVYSGYWDGGTSELDAFDIKASRELFQLAGGPLSIGTGFNYYQEKFQGKPSLFAQAKLADPVAGTLCDPDSADPLLACDQRFGDSAAIIPYSADRKAYGLFAELIAPVTKELELTGSVRYDDYKDVGSTTNGKASFRWVPTKGLLVRGSVGTGFKAPTVPQLNAALQSYGVTSAPYDCTPALQAIATSLGAVCQPRGRQYDVLAGGNANLEPEKSRQASIGLVFEPTPNISLGADLWHVQIRDAFGQIAEDAAFADPATFSGSWATQTDIATGIVYLAYNQTNLNLGKSYATGIDFDLQGRASTDVGKVTSRLVATYMLREDQQQVPGGPYYSAIGENNFALGEVTFRWQGRLTTSLETGNWVHTVQLNFKSGYKDAVASVEVLGPGDTNTGDFEDVQLKVKNFFTFDWQTQWQATKQLSLTAGILNVLNEEPPLSLAEGGSGKGQMFGYDDRYYDIRGRTFYLNAAYSF
ncbi:MAG TPA: TonB-dependent receptor [Methylibium sp.]|nr:TonB-dependent receptor [Methylibium sp.]